MEILNASDLLNFAIRIEEFGELFYSKAALSVGDKEAASMLHRLADEEARHRDIFKEMLNKWGDQRPPESYPGEYMRYLRSFIDGKVVFQEGLEKTVIHDLSDTKSVLDFAIQRELDSILFYHELGAFISQSQRKVIDEVISEERKHIVLLSRLREKFI